MGASSVVLLLALAPSAQDARAAFVAALEESLRGNRYFKDVALESEESCAPLVLLVQKHPLDRPNYVATLANHYGKWLSRMTEVFDEQLAQPAGLTRAADRPYDCVCLLLSSGDYQNFRKVFYRAGPYGHYDPVIGLTVSYSAMGSFGAPHHDRYRVLAPFVEGLLDAHYTGEEDTLPSWWLRTGIAGYFAAHLGREPSALDSRVLPPDLPAEVVRVLGDANGRDVYLMRLHELLELEDATAAWARVRARASAVEMKASSSTFWNVTSALPALWVHFLHDGDDGRYREAFRAMLRDAMGGSPVADAFARAFDDVPRADLEHRFLNWVIDRNLEADPSPVDRSSIAAALAPGEEPGSPSAALDTSAIAPDEDDPRTAHGLALQVALAGDLDGALTAIEALLEAGAEPEPWPERLAREAFRLRELMRVRDAFLAHLAEEGGRLRLEVDGRSRTVSVERVEDGVIHLESDRAGLDRVEVDEVPIHGLAMEMSKYLSGSPDAWLRFYPYVLAGDERWKRLLKQDPPAAGALRQDAQEWYPEVLELGRAAAELARLADAGEPIDQGEAEQVLDAIRALLEGHGELALVAERRPALRELATAALGHFFDAAAQNTTLEGQLVHREDGRTSLTYEFERAEEAADFRRDDDYLSDMRDRIEAGDPAPEGDGFEVAHGSFAGTGALCYRLPVAFEAPVTLTVEVRYRPAPAVGDAVTYLWLGACDDGEGSYVMTDFAGNLTVIDRGSGYLATDFLPEGVSIEPTKPYVISLTVTAEEASSYKQGELVKHLPSGPRTKGEFFVFVHSNVPLAIDRLEVTGVLSLSEAAREQAEWTELELTALGF